VNVQANQHVSKKNWQSALNREQVFLLDKNGSFGFRFLFVRYHCGMIYQAKLATPVGVLGIRCNDSALMGIDWLPATAKPARASSPLAQKVCEQLLAYFANPDTKFSVPLKPNGTAHQQKVWQVMCNIPRGKTRSYGEIAAELKSAAQAIGQACGANPIPIIIPCHRIVGKSGLGGFMRHASGESIDIKRWLLAHEQR
jgi:methylated-DNA-[protein]-cysteine S-methyltransferase